MSETPSKKPEPSEVAAQVLDELSCRLLAAGDLDGAAKAAIGRVAIRLLWIEIAAARKPVAP